MGEIDKMLRSWAVLCVALLFAVALSSQVEDNHELTLGEAQAQADVEADGEESLSAQKSRVMAKAKKLLEMEKKVAEMGEQNSIIKAEIESTTKMEAAKAKLEKKPKGPKKKGY